MRSKGKTTLKGVKNDVITVRVSEQDKARYSAEAQNYGMNLSEYILYVLNHKTIKVIEGGVNIANAMYDLNCTMSKYHKSEEVPVEELKNAMTTCVDKMNRFCENLKENG